MVFAGVALELAAVVVLPEDPIIARFDKNWEENIGNPTWVVGKIVGEILLKVIFAGIDDGFYAVFFFEDGGESFKPTNDVGFFWRVDDFFWGEFHIDDWKQSPLKVADGADEIFGLGFAAATIGKIMVGASEDAGILGGLPFGGERFVTVGAALGGFDEGKFDALFFELGKIDVFLVRRDVDALDVAADKEVIQMDFAVDDAIIKPGTATDERDEDNNGEEKFAHG